MACTETIAASPLEITVVDFDGTNDLIISPDDQLGEAQISATTQFFSKLTQASVFPCGRSKQGIELQAVIDLTSYDDFALFALAFGAKVITDATDPLKKKIELRDDAGANPLTKRIIFKPTVTGVATTDANKWITFPAGQIIEQTTQMNFGNNSQVSYQVTIYASPEPVTNIRAIRGDITAVAA